MASVKSALVAGGTGSIGEAIVKVLLSADYQVFVPVREVDKSDRLSAYVKDAGGGKLEIIPGDLGIGESVRKSKDLVLKRCERLDLVVVSVGSNYYGHSLHKIPLADWEHFISDNLVTHFNLIHEYLDLLYTQGNGVFVTLTGPEADFVYPESGLMSVVAAAQKMLARVAAQEASGTGVKVYSVTSRTPVANRLQGGQTSEDWVSAEELGYYVLALAEQRLASSGQVIHELQSRNHIRSILNKK